MSATAAVAPEPDDPKKKKKTKAKESPAPAATLLAPAPAAPIIHLPKPSPIVEPAVAAEDALKSWKAYEALCREILDDGDYIFYVHSQDTGGKENKPQACRTRAIAEELAERQRKTNQKNIEIKPRKKRSAWDKLARFYNLYVPTAPGALCTSTIQQVGEYVVETLIGEAFRITTYQDAATLAPVKVSVLLNVEAPNGRTVLGDGACAVSERSRGTDSFAHADHDILSTAFTRAFNRGVSRCIGTGEVSAEEFEADASTNGATNGQTGATIAAAPSPQIARSSQEPLTQAPAEQERKAPEPSLAAAAPAQPAQSSPALATAHAFVNEAALPPRAEIPSELPGSPRQASFTDSEKSSSTPHAPEAKPGEAAPAGSSAKPSEGAATFGERVKAVHVAVFNKTSMVDQPLVAKLIFSLNPYPKPVKIFYKGKLDLGTKSQPAGGFQSSVKSLSDLAVRVEMIEGTLKEIGPAKFVEWAEQMVKAAEARGVFRND